MTQNKPEEDLKYDFENVFENNENKLGDNPSNYKDPPKLSKQARDASQLY